MRDPASRITQRERLFKRAEETLRQARRPAINLLYHSPSQHEPFRCALL
jgi:hypothetical protein